MPDLIFTGVVGLRNAKKFDRMGKASNLIDDFVKKIGFSNEMLFKFY